MDKSSKLSVQDDNGKEEVVLLHGIRYLTTCLLDVSHIDTFYYYNI